ncbi:hypothetical protein DITRI_Ditri17bG0111900 [Diplodiscus trichospermus]
MIMVRVKCLHIFICLYFHLLHYQNLHVSADESAYFPSENTLLDCGSLGSQAKSFDGRNWTTDVGSQFMASNSDSSFTVS